MSFKSDRPWCVLTPLPTPSKVNVALFCKVEFKIKLQNMSGMIKLLANVLKRNHFNLKIQVTALCILRRYQHTRTTSDYQTNSSILEKKILLLIQKEIKWQCLCWLKSHGCVLRTFNVTDALKTASQMKSYLAKPSRLQPISLGLAVSEPFTLLHCSDRVQQFILLCRLILRITLWIWCWRQ